MNTPIRDFVKAYAESDTARFHMPGHKGKDYLGFEKYDITEIGGADVLYSADGIIKDSELNATKLFGTYRTFYSAEGSSLCIKAMLALILSGRNDNTYILAGRNAHKAFIYACALLDADVKWLYPKDNEHICTCRITADDVNIALSSCEIMPSAVYLTSPDYLGNLSDIAAISKVCDKYNIPLLVDNAHGAYLHFLQEPIHPMDCGAFMCCDSAHKTLPVLTGGAYLHLSEKAKHLTDKTENILSVFASTSPSYLILQSLDICNEYIENGYKEKLSERVLVAECLKYELKNRGYYIEDTEPLKIVVNCSKSGLNSDDFINYLRVNSIEVEFYDEDYIVLMVSCDNSENELKLLLKAFSFYSSMLGEPFKKVPLSVEYGEKMMSIRKAVFSDKEIVDIKSSVGRICGCPTVSCPPAVPVAISGEVITENVAMYMSELGIKRIEVVK